MFRLKYKIAMLVLLVSLPCVIAIGTFSFVTAKHHVHEMVEYEYIGSLNRVKQIIRRNMADVAQDTRFLARTPAVMIFTPVKNNGGINPAERLHSEYWIRQLELVFFEMAREKPHFTSISLLDAEDIEIARIDRRGGAIQIAPRAERLRNPVSPFFKEALKAIGDEGVYTAPVDYDGAGGNRIHSAQFNLRFAAPVFLHEESPIAMVVVDIPAQEFLDVKKLFTVFQLKDVGDLFVVDQKGAYLHRPGIQHASGNVEHNDKAGDGLLSDYPGISSEILSGKEGSVIFKNRKIFYSTLAISETFSLVIGLDSPKSAIDAPVDQFKLVLLCVVAATLILTWLVSAFFTQGMLRAIYTLRAVTERISKGDLQTNVDIHSHDEIGELGKGFNSMVAALRKMTHRLTGLYNLGIFRGRDSVDTADRIVAFICSATKADMATVEKNDGENRSVVSFYDNGRITHGGVLPGADSPCADVVTESDYCRYTQVSTQFPGNVFLNEHGVNTYVGAPVISARGDVMGIIAILDKSELIVPKEDIELLYTLSRYAAFEWEMEAYIDQIRNASLETIHRLLRAAESRDEDTGMHLQRMSRYSAAVARKLGMDEKNVEAVLYASPMHDVGKIAVPDRILLKPGKLDPEEWEIMKGHTLLGSRILAGSHGDFIKLAEIIALTHHERWDGTGYPNGLKGTKIPLEGRITAIADVFDALTSRRPYKEPFPLEKAFAIIREGRGSHFDPEVVDAFFMIEKEIVSIMGKYRD